MMATLTQKKIQLYPSLFKLHTSYRLLIEHPPEGYLILPPSAHNSSRIISLLRRVPLAREAYHLFLHISKSNILFEKMTDTVVPPDTDLVFAMSNVYRGSLPYVIEILDNPFSIAGYKYEVFMRHKHEIEHELSSQLCKKILCANTPCLNFMKNHFPKKVAEKCILVRTGIGAPLAHARTRKKTPVVKLLFIGSITNPQDFYSKGGLETVELFENICQKRNVRLTIRCRVPREIAGRIIKNKKITLIEKEIPQSELQKLYMDSDIFLLPGHHFHLMAMLEAMFYGLPVIALDTYAFSDYVVNGYNGFLIKKSRHVQGYQEPGYPCNVKSKDFLAEIKNVDKRVIDDLCRRVVQLIDNAPLRERYGKNSRKMISARFSLRQRNALLKKIFDEALRERVRARAAQDEEVRT